MLTERISKLAANFLKKLATTSVLRISSPFTPLPCHEFHNHVLEKLDAYFLKKPLYSAFFLPHATPLSFAILHQRHSPVFASLPVHHSFSCVEECEFEVLQPKIKVQERGTIADMGWWHGSITEEAKEGEGRTQREPMEEAQEKGKIGRIMNHKNVIEEEWFWSTKIAKQTKKMKEILFTEGKKKFLQCK